MISRRTTSWFLLALLVLLASTCTVSVEAQSPRFIELPEQEHCLNAFRCTSSDSTTNVTWKQENCVPKSIRDSRVSFIFNLAIIFIVGLIGNILTLAAFPYAWIYYRSSFPGVPSSITVLILHLALCDLLYCIIGMPNQMSIYTNSYLKGSSTSCSWVAWSRNSIAYSDMLTMASIALTLCIYITCSQTHLTKAANFFTPKRTGIFCIIFWLISFIIICPTTFGADGFGHWGYSDIQGRCSIIMCSEKEKQETSFWKGFFFLVGGCLPTLVILLSYLVLGQYIAAQNRKLKAIGQEGSKKVNITLMTVALTYFILIMPMLPVEFNLLENLSDPAFYSIVIYSAYWWIYAVNFVIYIATMENYRTVYLVFLRDVAHIVGAKKLASDPRLDYLPQRSGWGSGKKSDLASFDLSSSVQQVSRLDSK